jgi:hypothetical protein
MGQPILLPNEMFQDDTDINCYNLAVSTQDGVQYWDVDIFVRRYPRLGRLLVSKFESGILCFDVKRINLGLV